MTLEEYIALKSEVERRVVKQLGVGNPVFALWGSKRIAQEV